MIEPKILIDLNEVIRQTTLKKSTIYDQMREGIFPRPRQLGRKRVAWDQNLIEAYKNGTFPPTKEGAK